MKPLWIFLLACGSLYAQGSLTFVVCNSNCTVTTPLASPYSFPDTAVGHSGLIELKFTNSSTSTVKLLSISSSDSLDFYAPYPNSALGFQILPGATSSPFSIYFVPESIGALTSTLTVGYCLPDASGNCTGQPETVTAVLKGNGIAPPITLTCTGSQTQCDGKSVVLVSTIDFGYVSDGSTASVKFTVANTSPSVATVTLQSASTFSSDPSAPVPASVPAGGSATFTIDFFPTQTGLSQTTLTAGANSYTLEGTGVDSTPGGATPLKFQNCSPDCTSSTPLFTPWNFPDTPEGEENYLMLRPVNPTSSTVKLITYTVSDTQNFAITNDYVDEEIAPQQTGTPFFVHFTPQRTGALSAILTAIYCLPDSSGNCGLTSLTEPVVQLQGSGTAPEVMLTCKGSPQQCNGNRLTPASILDFGNVTVGSTTSVTFTVTNDSQSAVSVSLPTAANLSTPFSVDPSATLPISVAAGSNATFQVNFSPGQDVLSQATLVVGGSSFPLQGSGSATVPGDLSSLVVTYMNSTKGDPAYGDRYPADGGAIDFGQVSTGIPETFAVAVCSPASGPGGPVTVPVPTLSGPGFAASGLASAPVTIQSNAMPPYCEPGPDTVSFQITITASTVGTYTGSLAIGGLKYALTAHSVAPPLPSPTFQFSQQPLTSDQQVNLTIQLASPAQGDHIPVLTMAFTPSVQNVSDDPAVEFLATNGRQLSLKVANGSQTATYNGQSAIAFQTGTTAGKLTFTLTDAGITVGTQSLDIDPEKVLITSATATLSSPNIVVTINGYDNTYSTGQLSFTFYDTKGNPIAPGAIPVDATSQFHQYFFNNDPAGGAFALQATFPVYNGDASGVGSVSLTLNNSIGSTTTKLTVQ